MAPQAGDPAARGQGPPVGTARDAAADEAQALWTVRPVPQFRTRSPLARRIIAFNIFGIGALVVGVLYVTPLDEGLLAQRERALVVEARVISQGFAAFAPAAFGSAAAREQSVAAAVRLMGIFAASEPSRAQVYDQTGALLYDTGGPAAADGAGDGAAVGGQAATRPRPPQLDQSPGGPDTLIPGEVADDIVLTALSGLPDGRRLDDAEGRLIVAVALPIRRGEAVIGAVRVSTLPGEVDLILRTERDKLLQVFGVATIISVLLSLVLARTIARPLRRLAEAAEMGDGPKGRLMNPQRIRIPDLTGRPDEIGYLSGAMRRMTEALYDRIEAIQVFAADVAHEIKNPLTSLRSAVETLRVAGSDEARARLLSVIEKDVVRLDRLVTDISNASRLDAEMVREEMAAFPLTELLTNLVDFNGAKAREVGVTLVATLPDDPLTTLGLEGRLAQVFVNLIANAISFTPSGGRVEVAAERLGDGGTRITVSDTGPGIPDENLRDVFERFYSERPQRDFGNHSGLGLAISRQIVEAHGGRIWAENRRDADAGPDAPRQGARFCVELPQ